MEEKIISLPVTKLTEYHKHPFALYRGERLRLMAADIRENGILSALIVQPKGDKYEILSGHNRWNAAKLAGLSKVPCVVKEELSEAEADIIVTQSNLIQRSFNEMKPSEKARAVDMYMTALKAKHGGQGKRLDLQISTKISDYNAENSTSAQSGQKLTSRDKTGEQFGLSKTTVARLVRLNFLIPSLLKLVDEGKLGVIPACEISYLSQSEQEVLEVLILSSGEKLSVKKAEILKENSVKKSKNGGLIEKDILKILKNETDSKKLQNNEKELNKPKYLKFFKPDTPQEEIDETIIKALQYWKKAVESGKFADENASESENTLDEKEKSVSVPPPETKKTPPPDEEEDPADRF